VTTILMTESHVHIICSNTAQEIPELTQNDLACLACMALSVSCTDYLKILF